MICPQCQTEHNKVKFCCQSCAARYNNKLRPPRSPESKAKTSASLKNKPSKVKGRKIGPRSFPYTPIERRNCRCCDNGFWAYGRDKYAYRITCSPECARKNSTYRKIATRHISSAGEEVFLESSWEVEIARWLDEQHIEWTRPKHIPWKDSKGKSRKYFPDFYLPAFGIYLDPKNKYQIQLGSEKLSAVSKMINLFYGDVDHLKQIVKNLTNQPV